MLADFVFKHFLEALVLEPLKPKSAWPFAGTDTDEDEDDNDFDEEYLEWTEPELASKPEPESTPQAHGQTQL